ncbi:MAG: hypothetical protein FWB83_09945 [Treponema sp.]|nr:hypothetical protein [Treponema sp.]
MKNKKVFFIVIIVMLFFAGIIALTQEVDLLLPLTENPQSDDQINSTQAQMAAHLSKQDKWFKSNAGGMALEETQSRLTALRGQYALLIKTAGPGDIPDHLIPFYTDTYFPENRILFKNGQQARSQWIFRDRRGTTRLNAVIADPPASRNNDTTNRSVISTELEEESENRAVTAGTDRRIFNKGFIEIFDENSYLTEEYSFFENGEIRKINHNYNNGLLISSAVMLRVNEEENEYVNVYTDYYRYNRSSSLRNIERVFHLNAQNVSLREPEMISFPRHVMDAVNEKFMETERVNLYPDFFGDANVKTDEKIIFETDERGRIFTQVFHDEKDDVIWTITNTWFNDRIVSTVKEEGGVVYAAEFDYDQNGNRVEERNHRNGVLERVVRTEGNLDIEELYLNGAAVLRVIWEDGRKISETRLRQ